MLYVAGGALIFVLPGLGPLDDRFLPAIVEVGVAGSVLTALGMLFSIWGPCDPGA